MLGRTMHLGFVLLFFLSIFVLVYSCQFSEHPAPNQKARFSYYAARIRATGCRPRFPYQAVLGVWFRYCLGIGGSLHEGIRSIIDPLDALRPGIVGMRGSMVIRQRSCMTSSTPPPSTSLLSPPSAPPPLFQYAGRTPGTRLWRSFLDSA